MGCGTSRPEPVSQLTSLGSWGVGGPSLSNEVYGPKPRTVRSKVKLAELRQMLLYAHEAQKKLPEEEHRRLLCGLACFTERQSATLATATRYQWALSICSQLDTVTERELLQSDCFVPLRDFARVLGTDLEWCESRWEHNQERDAGHSTGLERLRETRRAVQTSAGLAFIVVLGDKLGPLDLPRTIDAKIFEAFLVELAKVGRTGERLATCYVKDTNVVPPVYMLHRIDKHLPNFRNMQAANLREQAELQWQKEYLTPMLEDIKIAVRGLQQQGSLPQVEVDTYLHPSIMQSALHGVLMDAQMGEGKKATRSVLVNRCFAHINAADPLASKYIDLQTAGSQDAQAAIALERVKATLKAAIPPENVLEFIVPWEPQGLDAANDRHQLYLSQLGDQITDLAARILADQLIRRPKLTDLEHEVHQHMCWLERHSKNLIGRPDALKRVKSFLEQRFEREQSLFSFLPPKRPGRSLIITGAEGCGKTRILCAAVAEVARPLLETESSMGSIMSGHYRRGEPTPVIIFRAIGHSHSLRTGRNLMRSICLQLSDVVESTEPVPTDYLELTVRFGMLLAEAGETRHVIVALDGLDQLVST